MSALTPSRQKLLHHLAVAVGFLWLIFWYFGAVQLGVIDLIVANFPQSHTGAGLMVAILIVMTPAFFIWKLYNRWIEKRLDIKGKFYEDSYYRSNSSHKQ